MPAAQVGMPPSTLQKFRQVPIDAPPLPTMQAVPREQNIMSEHA